MRAEHIELLQSPWLIELGAFYLNSRGLDAEECADCSTQFSFHSDETKSALIMSLPGSIKLEYDLTCAICLVFFTLVFNGEKSFHRCFQYYLISRACDLTGHRF